MILKVCGLREPRDGAAALEAGADLVGLVFYPPSPRYLAPETAHALLATLRRQYGSAGWQAVGVFVNEPAAHVNAVAEQCGLDYVQLHGTETAEYCADIERPVIKAARLAELPPPPLAARDFGAERLLIDSAVPGLWGGTGQRFDWEAARPYAAEALIAGGLSPDNVAEVVALLRPWGLDVSSGVERGGAKDPALIRAFVERARAAAAARSTP